MKNIYEQIIESLVNDDEAKARELFHQEVVRQSRNIYNQLVAEEAEEEEAEEEELDENFGMEGDDMSMDQTDDMMGDIESDEEGMGHDEAGEFGDEDHDEGGLEDRVMDLEDKLDQLQAEFADIMGDEAGEGHDDDDMDFGNEEGEEDYDSEEDDMEDESIMREYVEKVAAVGNTEGAGVGAGSIGGSTNAKSIVAGKNDMGGSAKNIAQGGTNPDPDGKQYSKPSNQYTKGAGNLKGAGSFENVPGAKAGKAFSNAKKPVTTDGAANKTSPVAK